MAPKARLADDAAPPAAPVPSLRTGYCIILAALLFLVLGSYAMLFSAFAGPSGIAV